MRVQPDGRFGELFEEGKGSSDMASVAMREDDAIERFGTVPLEGGEYVMEVT